MGNLRLAFNLLELHTCKVLKTLVNYSRRKITMYSKELMT